MISVIASPSDLPPFRQVLCLLQPTQVHPRLELLVAGRTIGELDYPALGTIRQGLLWKPRVQYLRANPRDAAYMLHLALAFARANAADVQVDAFVDPRLAVPDPLRQQFRQVWFGRLDLLEPGVSSELRERKYDALVLLYCDAIGLGWGQTERLLARLDVRQIIALNGRRRAFVWDADSRRELRWRRFVENTWLVELVLALGAFVAAAPLAIYDAVRRSKKN